ncbi:MAG: protease pro-enzyme activation domain-containing protein [Actinomycetota bacterium]|nr:protease pro-enzyme activation domain-containing protein [Actinomycetota bacterium]
MYLKPRDAAGAEAVARNVSDPHSAQYGHYLSTDQVRQQFAPTPATVDAVRSWLSTGGFQVGSVPANNAYVEATGSVAQIEKAFAVTVGEYAVGSRRLRSADRDLSVPAGIASDVLGVAGINESPTHATPLHTTGAGSQTGTAAPAAGQPGVVPPPAGFRNARPCGAYYGEKIDADDPAYQGQHLPYAPCGYTPGQIRSANGLADPVGRGVDGTGTTVAIVDAFGSPTLFDDAAEYARRNDSAHPLTAGQFTQQVAPPTPGQEAPDQCDAAGWYGEQTLDVEAVHATAPGAHILYVGGADCQDSSLDAALNSIVATHSADIVSNSYGDAGEDLPVTLIQEFNQIAVQAAMEGIGLYFSSGDSGDEVAHLKGQPTPDFAASDPWVTAVGGTSLGIGATGNKVVETGWETARSVLSSDRYSSATYQSGSGGGTSRVFAEPWYQQGVVPDALARQNQAGATAGRVVPDVANLADPNTGFLIGETQTFPDGAYYDEYRIGGTSLASPLMAGTMAVADQLDGFHHGFSNPAFYQLTARTGGLTDVTPVSALGVARVDYTNRVDASGGLVKSVRTFDDQSLTIHTTPGYDNVTGLGTPSGLLAAAPSRLADLSIAVGAPTQSGAGTYTSTVTVTNNGPTTATGVFTGLFAGGGLTVTGAPGGGVFFFGRTAVYTIPAVAPGLTVTLPVSFTANPGAHGIQYLAAATGTVQTPDPNYFNNVTATSILLP